MNPEVMMRATVGWLLAVGLVLGLATAAAAQSSLSQFGGYTAGVTNGYPLGTNWSGYYGLNPGGYFRRSYNEPFSFYGSKYVVPKAADYNTGYYTYNQPFVYYGANNVLPRTGAYAYRPTYSFRPGLTNYYSSGYHAPGVVLPRTSYYTPGTVTYGNYQLPDTATYGTPTPGGYATYIAPSYRGYVMPRRNFTRYYVR